jgi:hypothetical protein
MKKTIFFLAMLFVSATALASEPTKTNEPPVYLTGQDEPAAMGVFDAENAVEIDGVHYAVGSTQSVVSSDTVIPSEQAPVYLDGNDEPVASPPTLPTSRDKLQGGESNEQ